jgi:hypothetical protein
MRLRAGMSRQAHRTSRVIILAKRKCKSPALPSFHTPYRLSLLQSLLLSLVLFMAMHNTLLLSAGNSAWLGCNTGLKCMSG